MWKGNKKKIMEEQKQREVGKGSQRGGKRRKENKIYGEGSEYRSRNVNV